MQLCPKTKITANRRLREPDQVNRSPMECLNKNNKSREQKGHALVGLRVTCNARDA